jgi:protein involved in polysaccharide export with SLBB domain
MLSPNEFVMKLFKSLILIAASLATHTSAAVDINADPNLTGAAPLPSFITGQQNNMQSNGGFDITAASATPVVLSRMFGAQLFSGTNADSGASIGFNPGYILNPGDSIQIRLWGAFTFDGALQVDPKGNIFLPNVGPVKVAGVSNSQLNALITSKVKQVYQANVSVYASLLQAQPVKVYVTGFVRSPGLYGGVTSDSLLNYLIKAGGVDPDRGSYVDISVKRGNRVRSTINLYDFLLDGKLGLSQFADGDTIVVGPRQHTFSVQGDVFNSYDFEFLNSSIPVIEALKWARPKPGATNITIIRQQSLAKRSEYYPIGNAAGRMLQDGDTLIVSTDRYAGTIQVRIEGAHSGEHAMILPYGSNMRAVLAKVHTNSMSQMSALQLYRTSVAQRQKEMLDVALRKLEEASLSAQSSTKEEAGLRMQEAQLISRFVAKARTVVPKGEVILNPNNLDKVLLEDGDVISIPQKTSLVMVHGEVMFPNAVSWKKGLRPKDYIELCGGLTQKSGNAKIIVIRQNGAAINAEDVDQLNPGDELMVLPKYESKNIEVTRGISTILYQLAVGAKVLLTI